MPRINEAYLNLRGLRAENLQEIFARDAVVAVMDPVYPVYADANVVAGAPEPAPSRCARRSRAEWTTRARSKR